MIIHKFVKQVLLVITGNYFVINYTFLVLFCVLYLINNKQAIMIYDEIMLHVHVHVVHHL